MYYESENGMSGMGFDPLTILGVGAGLAAGIAPLIGGKDDSAKDAAKIQLKMTREAALARAYEAERKKQLYSGVAMVVGAAVLAGIFVYASTRKK